MRWQPLIGEWCRRVILVFSTQLLVCHRHISNIPLNILPLNDGISESISCWNITAVLSVSKEERIFYVLRFPWNLHFTLNLLLPQNNFSRRNYIILRKLRNSTEKLGFTIQSKVPIWLRTLTSQNVLHALNENYSLNTKKLCFSFLYFVSNISIS